MKKQYRPLLDRLNESRNRYQQLTGTSNKTILWDWSKRRMDVCPET